MPSSRELKENTERHDVSTLQTGGPAEEKEDRHPAAQTETLSRITAEQGGQVWAFPKKGKE